MISKTIGWVVVALFTLVPWGVGMFWLFVLAFWDLPVCVSWSS